MAMIRKGRDSKDRRTISEDRRSSLPLFSLPPQKGDRIGLSPSSHLLRSSCNRALGRHRLANAPEDLASDDGWLTILAYKSTRL